MYKNGFGIYNLQWLMCHKTKPNQTRDEMVYHIIIKCSKLSQNVYKARHDWVGKVIRWELCKKLKFDHTNK